MASPREDEAVVVTRCRCRPGCLTWLRPADDLLITADGTALRVHVEDVVTYPQPSLFETAEAAHHSGSTWAS